jgi:MoaA/NifB/PqqE/SkfB family radical SAM enzyme
MNGPSRYFINLSFACNERCVFCAANLASGPEVVPARPRGVTVDDVAGLLAGMRAGDEVALAGGEPTLHRQFLPIVRHIAAAGANVTLFTNGLRLANPAFARSVIEAGVAHVQIGLFGATPESHDRITRRPGSFTRTLAALRVLGVLRRELTFVLELRILVARQCVHESEAIVRAVHREVDGVDAFSLNRLIFSADADAANSAISWADARRPINAAATLVRELGYQLKFAGLPLCVYQGDNADFVRASVLRRRSQSAHTHQGSVSYLDPYVAAGNQSRELIPRRALPGPCRACDYVTDCVGVEDWYVERYRTDGLLPVRRALARRSDKTPRVTVLCVTRNACEAVELTLESFRRRTSEPVRLLVADTGSEDGTLDYLRGLSWLELHTLAERQASAQALDEAARAAFGTHSNTLDYLAEQVNSEYFLTLDSDVELLEDGWLSRLIAAADRDSLAAIGEYEPRRGNIMPRLAPHMLLVRTSVFRKHRLSFAPSVVIQDSEDVSRFERFLADEQPTHGDLTVEVAGRFPSARFYTTASMLFSRLQTQGVRWCAIPPDMRSAYRHFGHMSWSGHDPVLGEEHMRSLAQIRARLDHYAHDRLVDAASAR